MFNRRDWILLLTFIIITIFADTAFGTLCNKVDYVGYNRRCCQMPVIYSYDSSATAAACNNGVPIDASFYTTIMNYTINRYQNCANDYKVDWNSAKVASELGPAICLQECGFNLLHLLNVDGSVNDVAVSLIIPSVAAVPWKPVVLEAATKCKAPLSLLKDQKVTVVNAATGTSKSCSVQPYAYMQCIISYTIGRCPALIKVLNPPATCTTDLINVDKCTALFSLTPLN